MSRSGRVAVIGCGRWGGNLLRDMVALRGVEGPRSVVACDASEATRAQVAQAYPGLEVRADAQEVFADASVGAVVVATNVPSHYTLALAALRAGKHVLVEKPLAGTSAEAEALRDEAARAGLVLMVDHLLLVDPAVEEVGRMVAAGSDGALGDLRHIYARRTNLGVVRTEENALWSLGPHDVAVMLRLFDAEPVRVTASGAAWLQPERAIHDSVFASLEFPPGPEGVTRLGHLHLSWLSPVKERAVTFIGSRAMAVFDDGNPEGRLRLHRRSAQVADGTPSISDEGSEPLALPDEPPLHRMCQAFLDCVDLGAPNPSDGVLGAQVVRVLEGIQAALEG